MLLELFDVLGATGAIWLAVMILLLVILRIKHWSLWWLCGGIVLLPVIAIPVNVLWVYPSYNYDIMAADYPEFESKYGGKPRRPEIPVPARCISGHHSMAGWEVSYAIGYDDLVEFIKKQGELNGTRSYVDDAAVIEWASRVGANGSSAEVHYSKITGIAVSTTNRW